MLRSQIFICCRYSIISKEIKERSTVLQSSALQDPHYLSEIKDNANRLTLQYVHRIFFDYFCFICSILFQFEPTWEKY